jgi:hypothetical protein
MSKIQWFGQPLFDGNPMLCMLVKSNVIFLEFLLQDNNSTISSKLQKFYKLNPCQSF